MEYIVRNDAIWRRISTYTKIDARIFTLSLTVFEILTFQMSDVENVGQGHRVQLCNDANQWEISASIEVIMFILHYFSAFQIY